jgi:hypothetical protein
MPTITLRTEVKSMKKILDLVRKHPEIEIIPDISDDIDQAWLDEVSNRKQSLATGQTTLVSDSDAIFKARQNLKK